MRAMTHMIYTTVFRAQAFVGLVLAAWLIGTVLLQGQYAGVSLIFAVVTGVVALASLWPFLTPSWLGAPRHRNQLVPLMASHLILPILYCFVAVSAFLAADLAEPLAGQMLSASLFFIIGTSTVCWFSGARLCMTQRSAQKRTEGGTVTELILPQSRDASEKPVVTQSMSRAS